MAVKKTLEEICGTCKLRKQNNTCKESPRKPVGFYDWCGAWKGRKCPPYQGIELQRHREDATRRKEQKAMEKELVEGERMETIGEKKLREEGKWISISCGQHIKKEGN